MEFGSRCFITRYIGIFASGVFTAFTQDNKINWFACRCARTGWTHVIAVLNYYAERNAWKKSCYLFGYMDLHGVRVALIYTLNCIELKFHILSNIMLSVISFIVACQLHKLPLLSFIFAIDIFTILFNCLWYNHTQACNYLTQYYLASKIQRLESTHSCYLSYTQFPENILIIQQHHSKKSPNPGTIHSKGHI